MKTILRTLCVALIGLPLLAACDTDAVVASRNLSRAADMFEINRRIVFYNSITDSYMLSIEGRCSLGISQLKVTVTCKTGPNQFKKHYLGRSDNTTFFAEQLQAKDVSVYHYRVVFKPQTIIPDIDFRGDVKAFKKALVQ